jgi:hypothetical protein
LIATGVANLTLCQPEAVSPVNVAFASLRPLELHSVPECLPWFPGPLKNLMPTISPARDERNTTPSSAARRAPTARIRGVADPKNVTVAVGAVGWARCAVACAAGPLATESQHALARSASNAQLRPTQPLMRTANRSP